MQLVVPLIAPVVLRAGKTLSQQTQHRENHIGRLFLRDGAELINVDFLTVSKAQVQNGSHFLKGINSLLKCCRSASFLSEFTLAIYSHRSSYYRHACDDGGDVGLCYLSIIIKVIYVEDEFQLLVELRTVNTEEAGQELF